MYLLFYVEV